VSIILGQGLLLGNVTLLEYGGLVWLLFHLFALVYEEPALRRSFGSEYELFCIEVRDGFRVSPHGAVIPTRERTSAIAVLPGGSQKGLSEGARNEVLGRPASTDNRHDPRSGMVLVFRQFR
jgi:hypothetical protein